MGSLIINSLHNHCRVQGWKNENRSTFAEVIGVVFFYETRCSMPLPDWLWLISLSSVVCCSLVENLWDRRLASAQPNLPTWGYRSRNWTLNPTLTLKLTLTLTLFIKIFNPNPNPFLKENKNDTGGQHRVIFTGYLLRDGGACIRCLRAKKPMLLERLNPGNVHVFYNPYTSTMNLTCRYNSMLNFIQVSFCFLLFLGYV